jgi:hypothetical protein
MFHHHARRFGSSFKPGRLDGEKARRRASLNRAPEL